MIVDAHPLDEQPDRRRGGGLSFPSLSRALFERPRINDTARDRFET
ncbi:hypothetical protein H0A73_17875 [Alcaligenaceae bacterium]|nr:hypothetical protein [Alcaligenaceae bacterium]